MGVHIILNGFRNKEAVSTLLVGRYILIRCPLRLRQNDEEISGWLQDRDFPIFLKEGPSDLELPENSYMQAFLPHPSLPEDVGVEITLDESFDLLPKV